MTPERWRQITEIFHGAIAIRDAPAREAYLHDACSDDPLLRQEIDSLLAAHVDGTSSIDAPQPQAVSLTNRLAPGTMLGPYRVEELIGAGGMGEVYRAHDSRLGRTVALKTLPIHLRANPQLLTRFEREARAVAALNHPYICTLHDVGRDSGIDFLVMELVEGETLSSRLRRGRLPVAEAVRTAREVAEALAAAHARGIIHRDIKPSNVILTSGGHAKVVDFGLARSSVLFQNDDPAKDESTQTDVIVGTPRYMSPEQALGQPLDPRTDIFSLGVVLFECLTGELPFEGKTKGEYRQNLLTGHVKSIAALRSDVPDALRAILTRCLERNPAKRLDSAAWLATELDQIARGKSGIGFFGRRVPWWVAGGAALAVAIVGALALMSHFSAQSSPPAGPDVLQLRQFTTSAGDESDSHLSPDGMWMSFIATERGERHLYVALVDSDEQRRPVTLPPGVLQSHIWSSDQKSFACLVYQDSGWTVQIVSTPFGSDVPIQTVAVPQIPRAARLLRWIDRAIYLQVEESGRSLSFRRLNLDGGRFERLDGPWSAMTVRGFDVGPDGRQVVWSATEGATQRDDLWVANLDGGHPEQLTNQDDTSRKRFPLWNGVGTAVIYQSTRGGQVDLWEMDIRTRRSVQRTTDRAIERPESSSKNGSISYQLTAQKASLWTWNIRDRNGTQISDEGLSDFAPSTSLEGTPRLAFQRSLPSPVEGFLQVDSEIFVADVANPVTRLATARKVGRGFSPRLSPDGRFVSYLERDRDSSGPMHLMVRNVETSGIEAVSSAAMLPAGISFPVDWVEQNQAWASPDDLFFVERTDLPGVSHLAHYRVGSRATSLAATRTTSRIADIYPSADTKTIAYLTRSPSPDPEREVYQVHAVDLATGADRVVYDVGPQYLARLRGWLGDGAGLVLARSAAFSETEQTWTMDLLVVALNGVVRQTARVDHVSTLSQLVPRQSDLYVTRSLGGVGNLFAYSFATRKLRQVSENSVLDVTFGSVAPLGADHVVGIRHEQTTDIHLLDATPRSARKSGNR